MLRGQMQESRGSALFFYFGQPSNQRPRVLWAHLSVVLPFDRWEIGRRHLQRASRYQNLGPTEVVWRLLLTWIHLRELETVQFGHIQMDTDLGMQALLFPSNQPCVLPDQLARHPVLRRTLQSGEDLMEINSSLIPSQRRRSQFRRWNGLIRTCQRFFWEYFVCFGVNWLLLVHHHHHPLALVSEACWKKLCWATKLGVPKTE